MSTRRLLSLAAYGYATRRWDALTRASVGRIQQSFETTGRESFAVVSAWRDRPDMTAASAKAENQAAMESLERDVGRRGYGRIRLSGFHQAPEGDVSHQSSLFVPGMKRQEAMELGKKHGQVSILAAGPETGGQVQHIKVEDGTVEHMWPRLQPAAISTYYWRLRGGKEDGKAWARSFGLHYHVGGIGEAQVLDITIRRVQRRYGMPTDWRHRAGLVEERYG